MRTKIIMLVLSAFVIFNLSQAFSIEAVEPKEKTDSGAAILEEIKWLQAEAIITIATRHATSVSTAPGIATVITAKQIKQLGFRKLTDVLDIVPGFQVSMDETGEQEIAVRGVLDASSYKIKVLIDGHSINEPNGGSAMWNFDDLVVENAKRIEIIRGPGSALYGQNAFLAVVNVITKDTEDIDGFQVTSSGGTFDTQNHNVLFGKEYGGLKISGFFDFYDTEGFSKKIEQDLVFPASYSKSPGRSHNRKEKVDLNLKLSYRNLELNTKYMKKRRKDYIGIGHSLNDDTMIRSTYIFSELIYKWELGEKIESITKLYYDQNNQDSVFEQRPNNYVDIYGRTYPDGIKGRLPLKNRTIGFDNQFNYTVFKGNEATFGLQYEWIRHHDVKYWANIDPLTFAPLPLAVDYTHDFPYSREATRHIMAFYLQDVWNITGNVDLTVGVRHDRFTKFGGTTNPRVGLVWRFMEDAHLKLLFATAFRAPNFQELYFVNNPQRVGNPNLDPEKTNTFEASLGYNFTSHISGNINYFYNRIRDRIILDTAPSPDKFANSGGVRALGVEAELKGDLGNDNYAFANYTFQKSEDTRNRNRMPDVPVHKANFGLNVGAFKYVNASINTTITGPRPREDGDTRRDLPT
ncbi:MAG: TonB-dependent receptor plug domain-containing protein, partial [Planctomycetota bacterium]